MTDLPALRKRVEGLTSGDRAIDFALCKAVGAIPADAALVVGNDPIETMLGEARGYWELPTYTEEKQAWRAKLDAFIGSPAYYADKSGKWVEENPGPGTNADWNNPPSGQTPPVTSSIDAALALVERVLPTSLFDLRQRIGGHEWSVTLTDGGFCVEEGANTPPLAIILALLRALESTTPNPEGKSDAE